MTSSNAVKDEAWTALGECSAFSPGIHIVTLQQGSVGLAVLDGRFIAFFPYCPHLGGTLSRPEVCGTIITCPFHGWRFDLSSDGQEIHGYRPLKIYETRIEDGLILARIKR
jgi:nitrite reductase/ring-hydroxylating ferredoxin subunit